MEWEYICPCSNMAEPRGRADSCLMAYSIMTFSLSVSCLLLPLNIQAAARTTTSTAQPTATPVITGVLEEEVVAPLD